MVIRLIKTFKRKKEKAAALEGRIAKELMKELPELHLAYGFESVPKLFKAIREAHRGTAKGKVIPKKRNRAKITAAIRATVGKMLMAGVLGSTIAKATGIPLPSVYNVKKAVKKARKHKKVMAKGRCAPVKHKLLHRVSHKRMADRNIATPDGRRGQGPKEALPLQVA